MSSSHKTPERAIWLLAIAAALVGTAWWWWAAERSPLRVQVLDVSGYNEDQKAWMGFRVTVGLTNTGRDLVTIRRIHVEPDFDGFNEAYNVGTYELAPAIVVEPGSSVSYQAATTLLNAAQLPWARHTLRLRVRIEQDGADVEYEFPAEFDNAEQPGRRALRFGVN